MGKWRRGELGDLEVEEQNDIAAGDRKIHEFLSSPVYLPSCLARGDVNPALENMSANVRLNSHLQRKRKSPLIDRGREMNSCGPLILKNMKKRELSRLRDKFLHLGSCDEEDDARKKGSDSSDSEHDGKDVCNINDTSGNRVENLHYFCNVGIEEEDEEVQCNDDDDENEKESRRRNDYSQIGGIYGGGYDDHQEDEHDSDSQNVRTEDKNGDGGKEENFCSISVE